MVKPLFEQPLAVEPRSELVFLSCAFIAIATFAASVSAFGALFARGDHEAGHQLPQSGSQYGLDFLTQLPIVALALTLANLPSAFFLSRKLSWRALALGFLPYAVLVFWVFNE